MQEVLNQNGAQGEMESTQQNGYIEMNQVVFENKKGDKKTTNMSAAKAETLGLLDPKIKSVSAYRKTVNPNSVTGSSASLFKGNYDGLDETKQSVTSRFTNLIGFGK